MPLFKRVAVAAKLRCIVLLTLVIAWGFAVAVQAGAADYPFLGPAGAPATAFPKPDRPVASIISPIWHSEKERDAARETEQLVKLLKVISGMTVADIGAGSGFSTVRLSPIVGPTGRVIAQDITPAYLKGLVKRVNQLKLKNVTISLGEPHDPRLPAGSADLALLIHMYHEISDPYAFLHNLAPALKPGGRVGIIDARADTSKHGTPLALLKCELAAVGYREIVVHSLKGSDAYLAVFSPPATNGRPQPADIKTCKQDS